MAEYTYKDIIIDPNCEEAKNAVGKEVYYGYPAKYCLEVANKNCEENLGVLYSISEGENYPFYIDDPDEDENFGIEMIIVKKEPSYSERAKKWVEANDIKVGDYVKVTRKANEHEHGWQGLWWDNMDESVGKILKVKGIDVYIYTIGLENGFYYPYFVLEKTEPPKPEYVPFENVDEFLGSLSCVKTDNLDRVHRYLDAHGIWLKDKRAKVVVYCMVTKVWDSGLVICAERMRTDGIIELDNIISWIELYEGFTFLDGSPCGKLEEDSNG